MTRTSKSEVVGRLNNSQDGAVVSVQGVALTLTAGHGNCPKIISGGVAKTICLNYYDEQHRKRHCQDRIYSIDGISTAITTSFLPNILVYEQEDKTNDR
jgi:hypothetical protein